MPYSLSDGHLWFDGRPVLTGLDASTTLSTAFEQGAFLCSSTAQPASRLVLPLGKIVSLTRFASLPRRDPFWMKLVTGLRLSQVLPETQYLLSQREDGTYLLLIPLLDGAFRCALQGTPQDALELVADSADPAIQTASVTGLFVAVGTDPYNLIESAAPLVAQHLGSVRLRREKPLPDFVNQFGWCTWDSFYGDVSHEKVIEGLHSFHCSGVRPAFLILDDGWLSADVRSAAYRKLTAFTANDKFPGGLKETVRIAREQFGIQNFFVWHAFEGYWEGVDPQCFAEYAAFDLPRQYAPPLDQGGWWMEPATVGVIPPANIYRFYHDFHRYLRSQGVDGVKVDNQAMLESVARGSGGRVAMMKAYHEALEGSALVHFQGNLINCMSTSNDMLYHALASTVTRTSDDYFPNRPESHGAHLAVNAHVGMWFGEFIQPDWDMFQSAHPQGSFHAAGRAVSGGPVYISDKPEAHDFELLRKLAFRNGRVLRAQLPGRPTLDCLMHDPLSEDVILKVFNLNLGAGVLAAFNCRSGEGAPQLTGSFSPADIPGLVGDQFAVFAHQRHQLRRMSKDATWDLTLAPLDWEIFSAVPLDGAFAPIGLANMLNSGGAITAKGWTTPTCYHVSLCGGGHFLAWSKTEPLRVLANGAGIPFAYDSTEQTLEVPLPNRSQNYHLEICY
jgi:raffinose synthase